MRVMLGAFVATACAQLGCSSANCATESPGPTSSNTRVAMLSGAIEIRFQQRRGAALEDLTLISGESAQRDTDCFASAPPVTSNAIACSLIAAGFATAADGGLAVSASCDVRPFLRSSSGERLDRLNVVLHLPDPRKLETGTFEISLTADVSSDAVAGCSAHVDVDATIQATGAVGGAAPVPSGVTADFERDIVVCARVRKTVYGLPTALSDESPACELPMAGSTLRVHLIQLATDYQPVETRSVCR
jgi:hypothetical protein